MLARICTFAVDGVEARRVWVEADIRLGLPAFTVVGLADKAVREARERVRAALVNSGYEFPLRRITVNLAPAYLRKVGPAFDLPLAVALLVASGQLDAGDGRVLRDRRRALADRRGPRRSAGRSRSPRASAAHELRAARASRSRGRARPRSCPDIEVIGVESLQRPGRDAARGRRAAGAPGRAAGRGRAGCSTSPTSAATTRSIPGLEVAAAGGHNLFLQGPPGTGKTMIARRLPSILPPLSSDEAIEVTRIQSIAGLRGGGGPGHRAPVPRAAPHGLRRRPRRRREPAAARRGDAGPPRRALPRRAVRVRPPEPRGAAPAARGRPRHDRPRPAGDGLPDALHARRRLEPVPVRPRRRALPVHARPTSPATAAASPARCWTASTS